MHHSHSILILIKHLDDERYNLEMHRRQSVNNKMMQTSETEEYVKLCEKKIADIEDAIKILS